MPFFQVSVTRHQLQSEEFTVKAENKEALQKILERIDFGCIDERFDQGEVQSIDYEVNSVKEVEKPSSQSFADEDLQELIGGDDEEDDDEDEFEEDDEFEDDDDDDDDEDDDEETSKRVVVYVEKGQAHVKLDKGVEFELIDWDDIKDCGNGWTNEQIDNLQKWGEGLVPPDVIERLREYAVKDKEV